MTERESFAEFQNAIALADAFAVASSAASLEETSASGQQISAMTQRNAENSRTAASLMAEVDSRVQ